MDRRSFLRGALGIVAGLVALPFVPKRSDTVLDEPHVLSVQKWVGPNGTEDQFAVYDRVLSPGEVRRHYEAVLRQDSRWHHVTALHDGRIYIDGEIT